MIADPPKNRMGLARLRVAIPAQLRAVKKLLDPKSMGLPDTAYACRKLAEDATNRGHLRTQISETVLFGKVKDPKLMVLIFRGQLQCRIGGKREGPIEA